MLTFLYRTFAGRLILKILCKPSVSDLAGRFLDTRMSCRLIPSFVRKNHIDLTEFESDFSCFNDCFSRKIKPGFRPFDRDPQALVSPCDGLLSVYPVSDLTVLPVKQSRYSIPDLLNDRDLACDFADGLCLVFRLCVNHYHRYCYFDDGIKGDNVKIGGILHTVRPIALSEYPVFVQNSREYTVIDTQHFGKAVQMEVGALLVGKIENYHGAGACRRGEEKGRFLYGGSTVIVLLQKGSVVMDPAFSQVLGTGGELAVCMGARIGFAPSDTNRMKMSHFS